MKSFRVMLVGTILLSLHSSTRISAWGVSLPNDGTPYDTESAGNVLEDDSTWGTMSPGITYVITPGGFKEPPGPGEGAGIVVSPFRIEIRGAPLSEVSVKLNLPDAFVSAGTPDSLSLTWWTYMVPPKDWCLHCGESGPIIGDSVRIYIDSSGMQILQVGATVAVPTEASAGIYTAEISGSWSGASDSRPSVGRPEFVSGISADTTVKRTIEVQEITDASTGDFRPKSIALHQNYPNPFNPSTTITFTIPAAAEVGLRIYDIFGSEVAVLTDRRMPAGEHSVVWHAAGSPSGTYFCRLQRGDVVETKRMMLIK